MSLKFFKKFLIFTNTYPQKYITSNKLPEKYCDSLGKNYFKTRSNTPKIKVEATNPIPTNPAIIPVFK